MTFVPDSPVVVCVLGMHRSGTSAVMGSLASLGVYLGPDEHLMEPREDNPAGFFEHQGLVDLNDEILQAFGGTWREPPVFPTAWTNAPALDDIRRRAARLLRDDFTGVAVWGWKDPRTCLTLPFWRPLVPNLRFVVCVRDPHAVARSLEARDGLSLETSIRLWHRHTAAAVCGVGDAPTLLVGYDDLVDDPERELDRLHAFVHGRAREVVNRGTATHASPRLRHHAADSSARLQTPGMSYDAVALYLSLQSWIAGQREGRFGSDDLAAASRLLAQAIGAREDREDETRGLVAQLLEDSRTLAAQSLELGVLQRQLDEVRRQAHDEHLARVQEAAAARSSLDAAVQARERVDRLLEDMRASRDRDAVEMREQHETIAALRSALADAEARGASLELEVTALETAVRAAVRDHAALADLVDEGQSALADLQGQLVAARHDAAVVRETAEVLRAEELRLLRLLGHCSTTLGASKALIRTVMPTPLHRAARRTLQRVAPRLLLEP